ncbi:type IX secretion system periplasmic lipoprotein PorW/SprE [Flavobacterium psychrophilum]|uniref:type IX secretion system periplasmic lipoprotein PorW/SprE n=1 Tax=Flavobacterium psychrophilum TaxID=96345 RepID=UPI001D0618DB|nr:gliding motility protein [Flavobacterium psychrophilum]MCB6097854.1 gliding motility protein [Flavobacterium psychrophilum]
MKTNSLKHISLSLLFVLAVACSTKKNTFVSRNWHAINSEYNVLYNGGVALQLGINDLKTGYKDNFWEILPVERMQILEEAILPGQKAKNQNFERAETKATIAIQKHSMNIEGKEKNMQMDEAHLLLGKSRYYDQRFIPALEAFNYILYKYSNSDKIYEAKIWREKTNIRLENDALAVKNLKRLLKNYKIKPQIFADANAILSQAYLNLEQKDSAIAPLKKALVSTKLKEEKARYHFILGQLYQSLEYKDSAYAAFEEVIKMKRKSPKQYVMQAYAKQSELVDQTQDTVLFLKKYAKLFKDRENRPHHDILNYQMASFYDKLNKKEQAIKYYNKSLRSKSDDSYLQATTHKNLATIYFDKAKYIMAGQYYDSTLTRLVQKNREYFSIVKKRENLVDVIKYEGIVQHNDSILNIVALSKYDQKSYFEDYILKIKAKEEAKKLLEAKQKKANQDTGIQDIDMVKVKPKNISSDPSFLPPGAGFGISTDNSFYFYNPITVNYGKVAFLKKWKKRPLTDNWRWITELSDIKNTDQVIANTVIAKTEEVPENFQADFYLKQLPTSQKTLDSLARERNFANYQLGVIYKEKFKEYKLSASKFEFLLKSNPEERLVLPAMYNLYKTYEIINKEKSEIIKNKIITNYPNTRYAQILNGTIVEENAIVQTPAAVYKTIYNQFNNQEYVAVLETIEKSLAQFAGDDLIPKFELLKSSVIGKLKGVDEYKKSLNFVSLNFPNTKEGKQAEEILQNNIPVLEKMTFVNDTLSKNWKILYKAATKEDNETKILIEKINKYIKEKQYDTFSVSYDVYTETENFVVIHGIKSKEYSDYLINILKDTKDYKIVTPAKVISSENYSVIQVKKNYNQLLELK